MTNAKCNISSLNNYLNLIGMILLPAILVITLVYFIYVIYNKNKKIKEDFSIVSDYNSPMGTGCEYSNNSYASNIAPLRDCTLYFTDLKKECDEEYANDPSNTCKYVLDGWKEMESLNDVPYTKKIYKSDYTNNLTLNDDLTANLCFKQFLNNTEQNYEYNYNDTVRHYCAGNTFFLNNNRYTTLQFKNSDDNTPYTKHQNVINAICSKKMKTISDIQNKEFIKIKLSQDNRILNNTLYKIILNDDQTGFSSEKSFSFNSQVQNGAYKLAYHSYENGIHKFNIFRNTEIKNIPITIYKFKYNYLCENGQIIGSNTCPSDINLNNLVTIIGNNYVIKSSSELGLTIPSDLNYDFFSRYTYNNGNNRKDDIKAGIINMKKDIIKLIESDNNYEKKLIDTSILNETEKYDSVYNSYLNDIENKINSNNYNVGNLDIITNKLGIFKGCFIDFNQFNHNFNFNETVVLQTKILIKGLSYIKVQGYFNDNIGYFQNKNPIATRIGGCLNFENIYISTNGFQTIDPYVISRYNYFIKKKYYYSRWDRQWYYYYYWDYYISNQMVSDDKYGSAKSFEYSYKFHGIFKANVSGIYYFKTTSDDASYLYINNKLVVNNGGQHGMETRQSYGIYFHKNTFHKIEIYFGENRGGDNLQVAFKIENVMDNWSTDFTGFFFTEKSDDISTRIIAKNDDFKYYYIFNEQKYSYILDVETTGNYHIIAIGGGGGGNNLYKGEPGNIIEHKNISLASGRYTISIGKGGDIDNNGENTSISGVSSVFNITANGGSRGLNINTNNGNNKINYLDNILSDIIINNDNVTLFGSKGNLIGGKLINGSGSGGDKNYPGSSGLVIIIKMIDRNILNETGRSFTSLTNSFDNTYDKYISDINLWRISYEYLFNFDIINSFYKEVFANKIFSYCIYSHMFLQKGYYKFIAYLSSNESLEDNVMSDFYIILNNNLYLISGHYTNNNLYTTNNYINIENSGFHKIYFKGIGKNNTNNTKRYSVIIKYKYIESGINNSVDINALNTNINNNYIIANRSDYNNDVGLNYFYHNAYNYMNSDIFTQVYPFHRISLPQNFNNFKNNMRDVYNLNILNEKKTIANNRLTNFNTYLNILKGIDTTTKNFTYTSIDNITFTPVIDSRILNLNNLIIDLDKILERTDLIPNVTISINDVDIFNNNIFEDSVKARQNITIERFDRNKLIEYQNSITNPGKITNATNRSLYFTLR